MKNEVKLISAAMVMLGLSTSALVVGLFVVTWLVALSIWRFGRIEQRWAPAGTVESGR